LRGVSRIGDRDFYHEASAGSVDFQHIAFSHPNGTNLRKIRIRIGESNLQTVANLSVWCERSGQGKDRSSQKYMKK